MPLPIMLDHQETKVRTSKVLTKIRNGQVARFCAIGHYLPFAVDWAAKMGYDGIWFDLEHRAMDPRESQAMLAASMAADIDVMVRCPFRTERTQLYRYFEDGACGLMFPLTDNREMAEHLVRSAKYPPIGNRGLDGADPVAGNGSAAWGPNGDTYTDQANDNTFIIVQIETLEAVSNLEDIISTPGIDGIFVGPGDLSLRLKFSEADKPEEDKLTVLKVCEMAAALCKKHDKAWGLPCGDYAAVELYSSMGAQLLSMGGEFVSVMNTWQDANSVFDRVLGETYGPFASPTAPDEAAAILAESRLQGQLLAANDAPRVASTVEAYAVQDAMIAAGDALGLGSVWGWKTGTAPLFTCGKWADGAVLSFPALKITAMEGEVGLIFGEDLPPKSTPYTEDEVWSAVASGAMVIEVCRSSFDEAWGPTEHQAMADVNNNAGVVVGGGFDAATARELAAGATISIIANGKELVKSTAVSGGVDPSANVVTVVNDLSSRGITLKAGELVITGAVAVTKDCKPGDHVVVSYEGLGEVSCTLAGMTLTASL